MSRPESVWDESGWHRGALRHVSPNEDARPDEERPSLLVIHNISLPARVFGGTAVTDLFLNRIQIDQHPSFQDLSGVRVSSHFFIQRAGELHQYVSIWRRAWHAGRSTFRGRERCNDFSIGVELEGSDFDPFTDAQYAALLTLTYELACMTPLTDVAGHQHIAPGRKTDPGPHFDWSRYQHQWLALAAKVDANLTMRFPSND